MRLSLENKSDCNVFNSPYHFLSGPEDTHLAKANMKRRALQGSIGLPHYDDINAARESGGVESSIQLFDLDKHLACQLTHVVHGLAGLVDGKEKGFKLHQYQQVIGQPSEGEGLNNRHLL